MSFVSPEFALFCLLFLPVYWSLAKRPQGQRVLLILTGYGLYATWVPLFAAVLLVYSTVIWGLGRWMQKAPSRQWPLVLGLTCVASFLLFLKYYEFIRATFQALLQNTGFFSLLPLLDVVTPVGVSFFTFQAVTYLVMVGRKPVSGRRWPEVLLFLSFWPTLFAGPILRAQDFFAQVDETDPHKSVGRPRQAWLALYLISWGLVQKVVLASWLSLEWVDPVYKFPEQYGSLSLAAAMLAYSLQIFLDFAGYTAIVTGLALLLGFRLPVNFRQPYLARNLADFWTRWHVSLSSFIRDYIYIPLGGNRLGWMRTQIHVLVGMLISGLWHGANWTFVVWGLMHGLGVVALNLARYWGMPAWPRWLAQICTFLFVSLAWVFFRADSLPQAWQMLHGLGASAASAPEAVNPAHLLGLVLLAVGVLGLSPWAEVIQNKVVATLSRLGPWGASLVLACVLCLVLFYGPEGVPNFIYYRF